VTAAVIFHFLGETFKPQQSVVSAGMPSRHAFYLLIYSIAH